MRNLTRIDQGSPTIGLSSDKKKEEEEETDLTATRLDVKEQVTQPNMCLFQGLGLGLVRKENGTNHNVESWLIFTWKAKVPKKVKVFLWVCI